MELDDLRNRLRSDLTEAMRSGDRVRTSLVRTLAAALSNAEAVETSHGAEPVPFGTAEVARRELTIDDARRIITQEIDDRTGVAAQYHRHEDGSHAARLEAEIGLLETYLDLAAQR